MNASSQGQYSTWQKQSLEYSWLWTIGLLLTALPTALTNIAVIVAVWKDPNRNLRRGPSNLLIASQATADFFVGFALETTCIWWFYTFAKVSIMVVEALSSLFSVASIFHMVALAYDRYVAVVRPMHYASIMTTRRGILLILSMWSYAAVYMIYRTILRPGNLILVNALSGLHTVLPAFLGLLMYGRLYHVLRGYRQNAGNLDESGRAVMQAYRRQRKMTIVLLAALLLFLVCMTPWFVFYQVIDACPGCAGNNVVQMYLFCFFFYLFMLKSLLNPWLYAWRLGKYREAFRRLLPWCRIPQRVGEGSDFCSQSDNTAHRSRNLRRSARKQ